MTSPTHSDDSLGLNTGTGRIVRLRSPGDLRVHVHHLAVGDDVGAADLEHRPYASVLPSTPVR